MGGKKLKRGGGGREGEEGKKRERVGGRGEIFCKYNMFSFQIFNQHTQTY